jgi:hypothetical protein
MKTLNGNIFLENRLNLCGEKEIPQEGRTRRVMKAESKFGWPISRWGDASRSDLTSTVDHQAHAPQIMRNFRVFLKRLKTPNLEYIAICYSY